MAPTRKSRSVNKRYSDYVAVSPSKSVGTPNKFGRHKRKLSDMLGSPWTDEEVDRFYRAYRKYGKDWKKVAAMVRSRTVEMVEALYTMNRAYLSLPEGTASVAGFVAMVSDHYNALEGSHNDQEMDDLPKQIHRPKKRSRGLLKLNSLKEDQLQSRLVGSSDGCAPPLKRRESDGCTVRKRTPRFPINFSSRGDNSGNYVSPCKRSHRRDVDDVAHGAALALTEAAQGGDFPQVSVLPYKTDPMKSTHLKGKQKMLETSGTKLQRNLMDNDCFEGSSGSGGAENGMSPGDASMFMDTEDAAAEEVYQKGKKSYGQKENNEFDDGGEACSGTGGLSIGSVGGRFDIEVSNVNFEQSSSQGERKRNNKPFFRAETSGLDALQTLADLSLMIQSSKVEPESPVLEADKPLTGVSDNHTSRRASSTGHRRYKNKVPIAREKLLNEFPRADAPKSGKSKPGRELKVGSKALSDGKQLAQPTKKSRKRSIKSSSFEALVNEEEKLSNNVTCAEQDNAPLKNCKSTRLVEYSSSNSNTSRTGADSAVSKAALPTLDGVELLPKRRNRRKMDPNTISTHKDMKLANIKSKDLPNKKIKLQEATFYQKDKASCCLSSYMVRRWSTFEWFYSAIDYPWFAKKEFVEYLNHVGLGHIPRLTRAEWGVIRSSLGKPRRFSRSFLLEEREKLRQYRECVRNHYTELRTGVREGLPTDLARPLSVGQRVMALHPETREVHDGSVLTVDHDKCRIQFDCAELGVAFVMDIDCMPVNLMDNMPEALRRESTALHRFFMNSGDPRLAQSASGPSMLHASSELLEKTPTITLMNNGQGHTGSGTPAKAADIVLPQRAAYAPCSVPQIHARETDIRALSEVTHALDKKEAILTELKFVNDILTKNKNESDIPIQISEGFKKQYAMVLLQLKEASDQVSSALLNLRQRNTYPGNPLPPWQKLHSLGLTSSIDNLSANNQLASNVVDIINNSRLEAQKLVHTAVQAISKVEAEQDAFSSVVAALDSLGEGANPELANGGMAFKPKLNCTFDPKMQCDSDAIEAKFPFELIMSCVATYHIIQMCTERQYPPADVVQMLDSSIKSLHPRCAQNLPIYREIQMCMGRVKTQILALVPS